MKPRILIIRLDDVGTWISKFSQEIDKDKISLVWDVAVEAVLQILEHEDRPTGGKL